MVEPSQEVEPIHGSPQLDEAFLAEFRARLLRASDDDSLIREACERLLAIDRIAFCWVGWVRDGSRDFQVAHTEEAGLAYLRGADLTWRAEGFGEGVEGIVARECRPEVIANVDAVAGDNGWITRVREFGFRGAAAFPLIHDGSLLGVLGMYAEEPGVFEEGAVAILQSAAEDLASAVQHQRQDRFRQLQMKSVESLRHLTLEIITKQDTHELLETIVQQATDLLQGDAGGMYLADLDRRTLECKVSYKTAEDYTGTILQFGEGAAGTVADSGEPLIIQDYRVWPKRAPVYDHDQPFCRVMSAPMIWGERLVGVLHVLRGEGKPTFLQQDLELLEVYANQASIVLRNASLLEAKTQKIEELALLHEISREALRSKDLDEMLELLIKRLIEITGTDCCYITLWDERRQIPHLRASHCLRSDLVQLPKIQAGDQSLTENALKVGEPLVIPDIKRTSYVESRLAEDYPGTAVLALPLIVGQHWLGAALIISEGPRDFPSEQIALSQQVTSLVAMALIRERAYEAEHQRARELATLREINLRLLTSFELQSFLENLLSYTLELTEADDAHFFLFEAGELKFGAALWAGHVQREPFSEPRPNGITYRVAKSGEMILVEDASRHEIYADDPWEGSIIALPMKVGGRVLGVMNVAFSKPHRFREEELRIITSLADQASIALQNVRMLEQASLEQRKIRLLYDITSALSKSFDWETVLDRAVDLTAVHLDGLYGEIYLYDSNLSRLRLAASSIWDGEKIKRLNQQIQSVLDKGVIGWSAAEKKPFLIHDVHQDDRWLHFPGMDEGVRSAMGAPILLGEDLLGVIAVMDAEVEAFSKEDQDLLMAISHQIALALSNADRYHQVEKQLAQLTAIQKVAQVINRRLETQPLLVEVVDQVGKVLGYPVVEIFLVEGEHLVQRSAIEIHGKDSLRIPLSRGVIGRVARNNAPAFVPDVSQDPDYIAGPPQSVSEIAVPLHKGGVVIGVLNVESADPAGLTEDDLWILSLFADQLSVAIENAALYDRLRQHMEELEQTVAERTSELAKALEQAREADRLKSQFVSDVSHELRTPLSNIRLYLELLADGREDRFPDYLDTLNRETDRLVTLIENLLAISQIDGDMSPPKAELLDLNLLVRVLVEDRRRLFEERDLELQSEMEEALPLVEGDPHMISQAIANLLTNAMNYTLPGGRISLETQSKTAADQLWATVTVRDTGLGISEQDQDKVFQRFFRGEASRRVGTPGTGLGLAISHEIISRHGGRIRFKSKIQEGSTFIVWLPAAKVAPED